MKKFLAVLTTLVLCLSVAAMAEESNCPHTNTFEWIEGLVYEQWSATNHKVIYGVNVECEDCDTWLDWYDEGYFEAHEFSGNKCVVCGFSRDDIPSPEELQREALQRITEKPDGIAGKTAIVIHNGNLRSAADKDANDLGAVIAGDEYEIVNYLVTDDQMVWLEIKYTTGTAWVSASLVKISGGDALDDEFASFYVGRTCKIKVSSGRARLAPGTKNPEIAYVRYLETYTILDAKAAADDTLWFQIKVDGTECWISSGLADVY